LLASGADLCLVGRFSLLVEDLSDVEVMSDFLLKKKKKKKEHGDESF
jgi:hypothetical protein